MRGVEVQLLRFLTQAKDVGEKVNGQIFALNVLTPGNSLQQPSSGGWVGLREGLFIFYFILFYFILFYFIRFYFVLLHFILFCFITFYFILLYFILFYFITFYFILLHFILFYFILFYFILFYYILFYFILLYFTLFYFILFCFVLFCFILFCFVFFILFYFTLFYLRKENFLAFACIQAPSLPARKALTAQNTLFRLQKFPSFLQFYVSLNVVLATNHRSFTIIRL